MGFLESEVYVFKFLKQFCNYILNSFLRLMYLSCYIVH